MMMQCFRRCCLNHVTLTTRMLSPLSPWETGSTSTCPRLLRSSVSTGTTTFRSQVMLPRHPVLSGVSVLELNKFTQHDWKIDSGKDTRLADRRTAEAELPAGSTFDINRACRIASLVDESTSCMTSQIWSLTTPCKHFMVTCHSSVHSVCIKFKVCDFTTSNDKKMPPIQVEYRLSMKKLRCSTYIWLYLRNDTR